MTLETLSENLDGLAKGYLSQIETGQREPSLTIAGKITKLTGGAVSFEDLMID